MITCQIRVSCEKKIGSYSDCRPDVRKEHSVNYELRADTPQELKECAADMVNVMIEKLEELDAACSFDTEKELASYHKYYK